MKNVLIAVVLMFIACVTGCSSGSSDSSDSSSTIPPLTADQKRADFDYMYGILSDNYPLFEVNKRVNGIDWLGNKDKYVERINATSNNVNYMLEMYKIIADLKNNHTGILIGEDYRYFSNIYLNMYAALEDVEPWRNVFTEAQPYFDDYWSGQADRLTSPQLYQSHDQMHTSSKTFENGESATFKIVEQDKIAYMNLSSMAQPSDSERKRIVDFYSKILNYANLIIDIRENTGGHDLYWIDQVVAPLITSSISFSTISLIRGGSFLNPFLKAKGIKTSDISMLPARTNYPAECKTDFTRFDECNITVSPSSDSIGFKGKIFLLVGPKTFSSAESFAMFCKDTGWATIIGAKTGGDGGVGGSGPVVAILPNSKLVFRFTSDMSLNADGSSNFEKKTTPDVLIGSGEDAYDKTLALISGK